MAFIEVLNSENALILNTPKRNELLQAGPPQLSECSVLGRGSYGTVLKAVFRAELAAVKVVRTRRDINQQALRNEAHILGWRQRNIVQIFKVESTPNFGLIIMERFAGQCLQAILDTTILPLSHRVRITLDILAGLCYCHKRALLHLDVKPQNVLLAFTPASEDASTNSRRQYVAKLCDFGSSLKLTVAEQKSAPNGAARGTVRYMSPEALREGELTSAADIYSLGVTMWQLQQRRLPYSSIARNDIVAYRVVKHELRPDAIVDNGTPSSNSDKRAGSAVSPQSCAPRANAVRNLHAEFNVKSPKCDADHKFVENIFAARSAEANIDKETAYTVICKCCWLTAAHARPHARELRRRLKHLLL